MPLLQIQDLTIAFPTRQGSALAVNQLNLSMEPSQILGLVGESGCGKSLSSLAILRLVPSPGVIEQGRITFNGQDLLSLSPEGMRKLRGAEIALIPQDPLTSLNPVYTIGDQIMEVLQLHQPSSQQVAQKKVIELLDMVRIPNAKDRLKDYPHQFSGGMRQRVMIAMALSCEPQLLIADEPTTALDVTVQAQILSLLKELQVEKKMAILLITHDLGVVAETCDRVAVMYAGRLVEQAGVFDLFKDPKHPYTQGLLKSLPVLKTKAQLNNHTQKQRLEPIEGQPPSITQMPNGCAFEPRCPHRMPECTQAFPETTQVSETHQVNCYLNIQDQTKMATIAQG